MSSPTGQPGGRQHLAGLDSVRFLCALLVVLSHTGLPTLSGQNLWVKGVRSLMALSLNGQGAVMVFFVISGLCIHLPNIPSGPANWRAFFARRYLRLGLPLAGAILVSTLMSGQIGGGGVWGVVWSLFAELIYYTFYPLLRAGAFRLGWGGLLAVSLITSLVVLLSSQQVLEPWLLPLWKIAVAFLPAWLLGCLLAEQVARNGLPDPVRLKLWCFRGFLWLAVMASFATVFHLQAVPPVRFSLSLLGVAGVAWLWLQHELAAGAVRPPPRWLEWCGAWSYSLYLTHPDAFHLWERLQKGTGWFPPGSWLEMILRVIFICGLAVAFYFILEAPSHRLARQAARRLAGRGPS